MEINKPTKTRTLKNTYLWLVLSFVCPPFAFAETSVSQPQAAELARQTLAKQANLPIKNLSVDSAEPVQWPDSSLGCPQPGMNYMQMITPGYRVSVLDTSNGKTYSVHIGAGRAIVCDKSANKGARAEKNLRFGKRWQQSQEAQKLLAARLSVEQSKIRIVGVRQVQTNTVDPRCTQESTSKQTQLIELSFNNQAYRYGVIDNHLTACDQIAGDS